MVAIDICPPLSATNLMSEAKVDVQSVIGHLQQNETSTSTQLVEKTSLESDSPINASHKKDSFLEEVNDEPLSKADALAKEIAEDFKDY